MCIPVCVFCRDKRADAGDALKVWKIQFTIVYMWDQI